MSDTKEEAKRLIDRLPDNVNWDDIMYEFYVRKKITDSLKAAEDGRTLSQDEVKKRLLPK